MVNKRLQMFWFMIAVANPLFQAAVMCTLMELYEPGKTHGVGLIACVLAVLVFGSLSSVLLFDFSEYLWNPKEKKDEVLGGWAIALTFVPFYGLLLPGYATWLVLAWRKVRASGFFFHSAIS